MMLRYKLIFYCVLFIKIDFNFYQMKKNFLLLVCMFKLYFVNEEDVIYFFKIFDKKFCLQFILEKMSDFNCDYNFLI